MYLTEDAVTQVMVDIATQVREFTLSFDYMAEEVIAHTTGDAGVTTLVESFQRMGAPWTYGINDLEDLAEHAHMAVLDNVRTAELHRSFWPERPVDSAIFDYYRLCTLRNLH